MDVVGKNLYDYQCFILGEKWSENQCPKQSGHGEAKVSAFQAESAFPGSSTERTWQNLRSYV